MKTGMLWYDDRPDRTLEEKVQRAIDHYRHKHCRFPDACCVHPSALKGDDDLRVDGVRVLAKNGVLRHHFWVGRKTRVMMISTAWVDTRRATDSPTTQRWRTDRSLT
jgi:hypothetical protein